MTDPILSRFDLLTVIRDEADELIDDTLATFVINSHMKNHPIVRAAQTSDDEERKTVENQLNEIYISNH